MWFIGVEVEQETSAPPPKKNPGSAPEMIALLGGDVKPALSLVSFFLAHQLEGVVIEPVTLFEKGRGCRPRCHGLYDLCHHWFEWAR